MKFKSAKYKAQKLADKTQSPHVVINILRQHNDQPFLVLTEKDYINLKALKGLTYHQLVTKIKPNPVPFYPEIFRLKVD